MRKAGVIFLSIVLLILWWRGVPIATWRWGWHRIYMQDAHSRAVLEINALGPFAIKKVVIVKPLNFDANNAVWRLGVDSSFPIDITPPFGILYRKGQEERVIVIDGFGRSGQGILWGSQISNFRRRWEGFSISTIEPIPGTEISLSITETGVRVINEFLGKEIDNIPVLSFPVSDPYEYADFDERQWGELDWKQLPF